uniref:ADAM metallopeptidase domain 9a n=1 Tax=Poecilia reticulata TaxID=8081 RepID=A0A3P9PWK7_POERE
AERIKASAAVLGQLVAAAEKLMKRKSETLSVMQEVGPCGTGSWTRLLPVRFGSPCWPDPVSSLFQNHCQYQGFVQDMEGSAVAMSVCGGLRGVMHLTNDSYGIEPLGSAPEQHLLYRLQDVTSQPRGCGTPHYRHDDATEHAQSDPEEIQHRRRSRLCADWSSLILQFKHMNGNETIYTQLNVRVVLVGLDIWTKQNLINTEGGAGEVLSRFTQWREKELVPRRRHDSAQLILMKSFGVTAGMAYVSTVCSRSHGGGINAFLNNNVAAFASIVAHELGHNLGMNHDDGRSCSCPAAACIMHSGAT